MDGQEIIESFDSLWFFCNIFSSTLPSPSFTPCCNGKTIESHLVDSPKPEQLKPRSPILQKQEIQSRDVEILVETSSKTSHLNEKTDLQIMKPGIVGTVEISESQEKERRDKRCCKSTSTKGRGQGFGHVKGFNDLGFSFRELGMEGRPVFVVPGFQQMEEICGSQRFESLSHTKMPSLSDGMAMKEHLKSWAHAVACSVR